MLNTMTTIFLFTLPWGFVVKTISLFIMWWTLDRKTVAAGPLGIRINISFRSQMIMSAILVALTSFISAEVDPEDIAWPFMTITLGLTTLWPFQAAWDYYRVWREYRRIARQKTREER